MTAPVLTMSFTTTFRESITPTGFITATGTGQVWTVGADYSVLAPETSAVDTSTVLAGQNADGSFYKITIANLLANSQPLEPTLEALAELPTTAGVVEQTSADVFAIRPIGTAASTDLLTMADGDLLYQTADADLTAVSALTTTGIVARTGAGAYSTRTLTGTASQITVTDGDGVAGDPTVALTDTAVTPGTFTYATVTVDQQGRLTDASSGSAPSAPTGILSNAGLSAAVAANALTISLTDAAGATPSGASFPSIPFRSATAATGTISQASVTAATSLVISSGSTLGTTSAGPFNLYVVAFDDGGTVRLGVIQCATGVSVRALAETGIDSATAEGGAGAADSAQIFYAGAAVTSKAFTVLGRLEFSTGQATAGTWATAPDIIEVYHPDFRLPGTVIDRAQGTVTANTTQTATTPIDNTIPQITEGVELTTAPITLKYAASRVQVDVRASLSHNTLGGLAVLHVHHNSTANAIGATVTSSSPATGYFIAGGMTLLHTPGVAGLSTYRLRAGTNTGAFYTGGYSATPYFNGTYVSAVISVSEIMA
jgi:hypothetical protein